MKNDMKSGITKLSIIRESTPTDGIALDEKTRPAATQFSRLSLRDERDTRAIRSRGW